MSPRRQVAAAAALGVAVGVTIGMRVRRALKRHIASGPVDIDAARVAYLHGRLTRYFEETG